MSSCPMKAALYVLFARDVVFTTLRAYTPFVWAFLDTWTLLLVCAVRLGAGNNIAKGVDKCKRPKERLQLYEYEGSPYCKLVRETLCVLDIDYISYPCPRETLSGYGVCLNSRFRPEVKKLGGLLMFPFLVDPNTNSKMYQSMDIVKYLWNTYGSEAKAPWNYRVAFWAPYRALSLCLCRLLRPCLDMGILRAPGRAAAKPLEFWGYENSAFCKRVAEVMTMLEIPHIYHTMPHGAEKRVAFAKDHADEISAVRKRLNLVQIPYLEDPNTNKHMFESKDIVGYLVDTYQTATVPAESWLHYSSRC